MQFHEVATQERPAVLRLSDGRLRVGAEVFSGSVLLVSGKALDWKPSHTREIEVMSLRDVLNADPAVDLLLIGTGATRSRIPVATAAALDEAGVAHEAMATNSAVRAHNALAGDVRVIAFAALSG